jgi:3-methyladenine DNA glycosylase AlkD
MPSKISPRDVAEEARRALAAKADPVRARGAERYFKEAIKSYGLRAADVHALAVELHGRVKADWTVGDAIELCDILVREPELEAKAIGTLVLNRFKRSFPPALFAQVKEWLAADRLDNWASVDTFCAEGMGAFLERYPAYVARIKTWVRHPNRWVKRASLVSFIKLARKPAFLPAIYELSVTAFPVDDDLVHKANGWLLREAGKTDPPRLEKFLLKHGPAIPRTTLRYAIERFPVAKRKVILLKTKSK